MGLVIPRTCQALSLLDDFALLLPLPGNSKQTITFLQDKDDKEIIQRARAWGSGHRERNPQTLAGARSSMSLNVSRAVGSQGRWRVQGRAGFPSGAKSQGCQKTQ